jgi:hypothetical protein
VVDVIDADGNLLAPNHFAANAPGAGPLVNPWGIVRAPSHFGRFSNMLLIGNVEDAKINALNPDTGAFLGPLTDSNNNAIVIPGLWDLSFGNAPHNGRPLMFGLLPSLHSLKAWRPAQPSGVTWFLCGPERRRQ